MNNSENKLLTEEEMKLVQSLVQRQRRNLIWVLENKPKEEIKDFPGLKNKVNVLTEVMKKLGMTVIS